MNPEKQNPNQPNQQPAAQTPPTQPQRPAGPQPYKRAAVPTQPNLPPAKPADPASTDAEPSMVTTGDIPDGSSADFAKFDKPKSKGWHSVKGFLSVVELFGGALLLALMINSFVFQSYQVFGESMTPTLGEGNRLIISKLGKSWSNVFGGQYTPPRGTVIVFKNPKNPDVQLVKRVIGLPGERVVVQEGSITVYNQEAPGGFNPDELHDADLVDFTTGQVDINVPDGHIFVSGDNRLPNGSLDSRNDLGTVPLGNVVGSLWMRIFPLSDAGFY